MVHTVLDQEILLNPDKGVAKVATTFPGLKFARKKGGESQDLRALVAQYAKWANDLHPAMAFSDFVVKVEDLGQKRPCQDFISDLRFGYEDKVRSADATRQADEEEAERREKYGGDAEEGDGLGDDMDDEEEMMRDMHAHEMDQDEQQQQREEEKEEEAAPVDPAVIEAQEAAARQARKDAAQQKRELFLASRKAAAAAKQAEEERAKAEDDFLNEDMTDMQTSVVLPDTSSSLAPASAGAAAADALEVVEAAATKSTSASKTKAADSLFASDMFTNDVDVPADPEDKDAEDDGELPIIPGFANQETQNSEAPPAATSQDNDADDENSEATAVQTARNIATADEDLSGPTLGDDFF
jgi:hypothetical protein